LHVHYGSTIRGIIENGAPKSIYQDYSNEIFSRLDLQQLNKYTDSLYDSTGYTFETFSALKCLPYIKYPIVIASNSPKYHVKRVLARLGLINLPISMYLTPDTQNGCTKCEPGFWNSFFAKYPLTDYSPSLIDDSKLNIIAVRKFGLSGFHVNSNFNLMDALVHFLDVFPQYHKLVITNNLKLSSKDAYWLNDDLFKFEDVKYLEAKNIVDCNSFNIDVKNTVISEISRDIQQKFVMNSGKHKPDILRKVVVDIGAGLLNMLSETISIYASAFQQAFPSGSSRKFPHLQLTYIAFESNEQLTSSIISKLNSYGLFVISDTLTKNSLLKRVSLQGSKVVDNVVIDITVHLLQQDFMVSDGLTALRSLLTIFKDQSPNQFMDSSNDDIVENCNQKEYRQVDMIVGSCVADLYSPNRLANRLLEIANNYPSLLYLPITFIGKTRFKNPINQSNIRHFSNNYKSKILTDDIVFDLYHNSLSERGHFMNPNILLQKFVCFGFHIIPPSSISTHSISSHQQDDNDLDIWTRYLSYSQSNWDISPTYHPYMWKSMLRFIAIGVLPKCLEFDFDLKSWFHSLLHETSIIIEDNGKDLASIHLIAENIDIVARLPLLSDNSSENFVYNDDESEALLNRHLNNNSVKILKMDETSSYIPSNYPMNVPTSKSSWKNSSTELIDDKRDHNYIIEERQMIEFKAPGIVHLVSDRLSCLEENQIMLKSIASLVSTGTELKIFLGDMDTLQPTDLTISSMRNQSLGYPLFYGYEPTV
jgi:FMN phosphatase YigB (HAD superfamily)